MLYRVIAAMLMIAGVAGCATSRDVRKLQVQIDELRETQGRMSRQLARIDSLSSSEVSDARSVVVDLKYSVSDLATRIDQIGARLDDLSQRVSRSGPTSSTPQVYRPPASTTYPGVDTQAVASEPADARAMYTEAYDAMMAEQYAKAIATFRTYVATAPESPETGSAIYWIGECFAAQGQTDSALIEFQKVVDSYPESEKVSAALFRIGNIYEERGDKKSAFPYYQRLRDEFPQSIEYQLLRRKLGE